ncbi:MAG: YcxB family protein [Lachnospiraceae bacterium]
MTILYEVKTGHTEKVLKAVVNFYDKKRSDRNKIMIQYAVLAALFFMLPRAMKMPTYGYGICWMIGALVVVLALTKKQLTYSNMKRKDKYYIERTEITMSFGHSGFEIKDEEKHSYKYHLIKKLYEDKEMFFFLMEDGDLFVVPREDFVLGDSDDFRQFVEQAADKKFEDVNSKQDFLGAKTVRREEADKKDKTN